MKVIILAFMLLLLTGCSENMAKYNTSLGWKYNEYVLNKLPSDTLHPITLSNNNLGYYDGLFGKESYCNIPPDYIINTARQCGYKENDFPYWIREDGCRMLGNYIICAADYNVYPYGTIIDTSLGKGIVIDTGSTLIKSDKWHYDHDIDLYTIWY